MESVSSPSLLPIFRSRQQAQMLAFLMWDADSEYSLTDLAEANTMPVSSVHREIVRAEQTGIVTSRYIGNTRLVTADPHSPYHEHLAPLLIKAFGPPIVLADALAGIAGIDSAWIFGSWAARLHGQTGPRPVGDIDLLICGEPDRETLYKALREPEKRLGRDINPTIRPAQWTTQGTGSFHATVTSRPLVPIDINHRPPADTAPDGPGP